MAATYFHATSRRVILAIRDQLEIRVILGRAQNSSSKGKTPAKKSRKVLFKRSNIHSSIALVPSPLLSKSFR